jgi:hypothetical protein
MTCDAVEKLLDRLGRFLEGKARRNELYAVRELVQYATELEEELPETVREKVEHFDGVVPLQTPFVYDPSAGNLLIDTIYLGMSSPQSFDAVTDPGPETH